MRRGYSSSRPATDLPSPPKGPAPGASDELELRPEPEGIEYFDDPPPRQPDPTLKGYLEQANKGTEERYTRYLRLRHPWQAWREDRRRRRQSRPTGASTKSPTVNW